VGRAHPADRAAGGRVKAIVVGGGIGGLAAAIALTRAGLAVEVHERAPAMKEVGAGISLWANALHALDRLGLGEAVKTQGLPGPPGGLRRWDGAVLSAPPADAVRTRWPVFMVGIHRADLLATLRAALAPDALRLGATAVGFEAGAAGVRVRFADGGEATGDLLVGADGLGSMTRARLFGETPPRYSGYTAWRGVTAVDRGLLPPGAGFESWGRGQRFGALPLRDGRVYWFATKNAPAGQPDEPGGRRAELLRRFGNWHPPLPALIAATPEDAILRNDIADRPPLARWGEGPVTLLGDAAHPMTPNLGQGGCQALEDAVVLGDCLRGAADVPAALRAYEARRIPRTSAIVRQARRLGRVGQWAHPVACAVRNALVRATPAAVTVRTLESIVGYTV
jgi:2-polyprenyl-6-methoxyphenol hydroxylase-like FAD-dependent oxidoreductase